MSWSTLLSLAVSVLVIEIVTPPSCLKKEMREKIANGTIKLERDCFGCPKRGDE